MRRHPLALTVRLFPGAVLLALLAAPVFGDGKVFAPRDYKGSVEERSQEAIIVFHGSTTPGEAREDIVLKISVEGVGDAREARSFGWVVPFPREPRIRKADGRLFKEAFDYVQARKARVTPSLGAKRPDAKSTGGAEAEKVEVLSRKVVGSYDTAVLREKAAGGLNEWLEKEGFQTIEKGEEILEFYRKKGSVFACMKVSDAELSRDGLVDLHPLRFSFKTGGQDGIYFPMKLSALQKKSFNVNLYVFYGKWINDRRSPFGYEHRGFRLNYRDWDTRKCEPNAGKSWSAPAADPFLGSMARRIPRLTKFFQTLYPGEKYYLTNIQAHGVKPADLRDWRDDLWLFPYYTNPDFVPYDARKGGPAAGAYPRARSR